ncbi:N-6 DNA methylase [Acinetobacter indicus]|uniref:N-6 DNA methylase n=1 Tax=Acinetobacter indicus TaxID=756892 RepID=UPI0034CDBF2D
MNLAFEAPTNFLEQIELLQSSHASNTANEYKKKIGQYFTSSQVAKFMASLITVNNLERSYKILDSCAGLGILGISTILYLVSKGARKIHLDAYELDEATALTLVKNLELLETYLLHIDFTFNVFEEDFLLSDITQDYDISVINPPYYKLAGDSKYRTDEKGLFKKSQNIYSSFIIKTLSFLKNHGQLVFISPRSFTNGSNFKDFRSLLTKNNFIEYIHLFNSRVSIFKNEKIRQENVIFKLVKSHNQSSIAITSSNCIKDIAENNLNKQYYSPELILNQLNQNFILIPKTKEQIEKYLQLLKFNESFEQRGYKISTGKIVQFRSENISEIKEDYSLLIYNSHHLNKHNIELKFKESDKKDRFFKLYGDYEKWLIPNQNYILMRRISLKESESRIVLGVYLAENSDGFIAVENHLNYIYHTKNKMEKSEVIGLALFLKSDLVENFFSLISGVTQVNANDIKALPIPSLKDLNKIYEESVN